jgi:hypothetical protein
MKKTPKGLFFATVIRLYIRARRDRLHFRVGKGAVPDVEVLDVTIQELVCATLLTSNLHVSLSVLIPVESSRSPTNPVSEYSLLRVRPSDADSMRQKSRDHRASSETCPIPQYDCK